MLRTTLVALSLVAASVGVAGCGSSPAPATRTSQRVATSVPSPSVPSAGTAAVSASESVPTIPATSPAASATAARHESGPDPRWRFYTADRHWYSSPWFSGVHRIMIGFGCNGSPWYDHDPRCPGKQGFHHGIDVAMPCGTPIRAGLAGTVLSPSAPGTPGPAYGVHPLRLRIAGPEGQHDVVIGHAREVFVRAGEHVRVGQRIALASDSGAPDGCHLHFEVRPPGGSYTSAVDPSAWLMLHPS
ncbi:M23 family metallopeptidase [Nocardioides sp. Iso805N]|uniref:M23 family metallopeptidase n=1 Tax=Nocardioides sp. Iso805N TaxID=1283287 RepID=UPI0012F96D84|nr:M23 family metallopeptidase [Nocardioides sp. Iso805N]